MLVLEYATAQSSISLKNFDLDGQDSLLKCAVVARYLDYTRYINNMLDPGAEPRVKVSSKTALYNLAGSSSNVFQVADESLEGKKNVSYGRAELLDRLEKLAGKNVVFEKTFISYSCPELTYSVISVPTLVDGITYTGPVISYKMNFNEHTKISRQIYSSIRNEKYITYELLTKNKTLNVRLSKEIDFENYILYKDSLDYYNKEKLNIKRQGSNKLSRLDSLNLNRIDRDLDRLDRTVSFNSISFQSIYEDDNIVSSKQASRNEKKGDQCRCKALEPPVDTDNDGFSVLIDCDDGDPTVYPGAPISKENGHPDDNCDGIPDGSCNDDDGDSFNGGPECDCDPNLDKKCDCNDSFDDIYPGAPINCFNNWPDDNCDGIPDSIQLQKRNDISLNAIDRIYAPWGLTKFGKDGRFYAYTGLLAAGAVSTIYFKVQSDKHYSDYRTSTRLSLRDKLYQKSNEDHHRFLVSLGGTVLVYAMSQLDLSLRFSKYKNNRSDVQQFRDDCVLHNEMEMEIELLPIRLSIEKTLETAVCFRF